MSKNRVHSFKYHTVIKPHEHLNVRKAVEKVSMR